MAVEDITDPSLERFEFPGFSLFTHAFSYQYISLEDRENISLISFTQYIGQGAHISVIPSAYANPFFLTVPPGMLYPSLIMAVLACIVASQAVITGSFQVIAHHTTRPYNNTTDIQTVTGTDYEIVVFSPSQSLSHIEHFSRTGVYPFCQLADDDRDDRRNSCLQQCKYAQSHCSLFSTKSRIDQRPGRSIWCLRDPRLLPDYLHGIGGSPDCLEAPNSPRSSCVHHLRPLGWNLFVHRSKQSTTRRMVYPNVSRDYNMRLHSLALWKGRTMDSRGIR